MKRIPSWSYEWVYYLTVTLLFLAVTLRTLLFYDQIPDVINRDLALLAVWLVLFFCEPAITRRWLGFFPIYLVIQSVLIVLLFLNPGSPDYFGILFALLSMRILQQLSPRLGAICIVIFIPLIAIPLVHTTGLLNALAFAVLYTAANAMFALYSLTTRRAVEANTRNQAIQMDLREINQQLQAYSNQLKRLSVSRERNRLARELHDSVTQTVFSMTLTTQSAILYFDRDRAQVKVQLEHLMDLTRSALAEMQALISQLAPQGMDRIGLAALLQQHLDSRVFPESLSVSLEVEGDQSLGPDEQRALFRISQEALNNIVKHAQATRACLHLHLTDPVWVEIKDNGQGFQPEQVKSHVGIGLSSMKERANEIGWDLQIQSSPGAGTSIQVKKEVSNG